MPVSTETIAVAIFRLNDLGRLEVVAALAVFMLAVILAVSLTLNWLAGRYGPDKSRRLLRCSACKVRFAERKGTPLFDSRLPPQKVESVLEHIAEGCGVRQTGRHCKVNRGTVGRLGKLAGEHARDLHDELVGLSPPDVRGPVR